jgi:Periplasmic binding protein-like domain
VGYAGLKRGPPPICSRPRRIQAAHERDLPVPETLSVVGFDDLPDAANTGLTTVHQPLADKDRIVARLLLQALDGTPHARQAHRATKPAGRAQLNRFAAQQTMSSAAAPLSYPPRRSDGDRFCRHHVNSAPHQAHTSTPTMDPAHPPDTGSEQL